MLFHSLKLLPTDEVIEISASDLVTGYVGQTGKKTSEWLSKARGKVLFIDEAYQLNPAKGGSFMQEAVDELVKGLTSEEYKGKLLVILAGYEKDMDEMLAVNAGLRSRFSEKLFFENFSPSVVEKLLRYNLDKSCLKLSAEADGYLSEIAERLTTVPEFGNGRDADTLCKRVYREFAKRKSTIDGTAGAEGGAYTKVLVESEDLEAALETIMMSRKVKHRSSGKLKDLFEGLIGCDAVVAKMKEYRSTIALAVEQGRDPKESVEFNFLFCGAPGTGEKGKNRRASRVMLVLLVRRRG